MGPLSPISPSNTLRPLSLGGFRPHAGCPRRGHPGGQVDALKACLTTDTVTILNGRDTGKSILLELLFWEEARLTSGTYEYIYVAQGHPQAERTWEKHVKVCEKAGRGFLVDRKNKGQDRWVETRAFGVNSGTRRHFWSGEREALANTRGPRANRLAGDECGFIHRSILTTCIPMLGTRRGKKVFVGTASRGGMGFVWFKSMFERGVEGSSSFMPGYRSFNMPMESNPFLTDEAIRNARLAFRDPSQPDVKTAEESEECDGAFVSDLGACFENLDKCFTLPWVKIAPGRYVRCDALGIPIVAIPGRKYVLGSDFGQKQDHTVFSVFDRTTREQVELWIQPLRRPYDEYVSNLSGLKKKWNDALVIGDAREAGHFALERLASEHDDYSKSVAVTGKGKHGKATLVARMKDLFLNASWHFLDVPAQREEFSIFQQVPIGEHQNGFRFEAPAGKHDDMVSAAMLASTVLQIEVAAPRPKAPEVEPLSPAWFLQQQRERRRVFARRGF